MLKNLSSIILMLAIVSSCATEAKEKANEPATLVQLVKVNHKNMSFPIRSSGKLTAKKEANLSFKTGGIIKSFMFDEGDYVKTGQVLATLDMDEVNAYLQQAKSAYNKAERDHKRILKLFADSAATLEQTQNVKTALNLAEANLQIAQFNARYSKITAPYSGHILKRFMNSGEMINAGMPVLSITADKSNWVMRVEVSDRDITRIQLNDTATVKLDAYPGVLLGARVTERAAGVSPRSGLFEIELSLNETNLELFTGFIGTVTIYPGDKRKLALIPVNTLNSASDKSGYVFIYDQQSETAQKRMVTVAALLDDSIAVSSGLDSISHVIGEGVAYLSTGKKVYLEN